MLDAVLRMHLSFHVILINSNFTAGPHAQHELRACPMTPRVCKNVIKIQVVAGAGTALPTPLCNFLLAAAVLQ